MGGAVLRKHCAEQIKPHIPQQLLGRNNDDLVLRRVKDREAISQSEKLFKVPQIFSLKRKVPSEKHFYDHFHHFSCPFVQPKDRSKSNQ